MLQRDIAQKTEQLFVKQLKRLLGYSQTHPQADDFTSCGFERASGDVSA